MSDTFMGFDAQPTLRSELLELRPLRNDDYDALYAAGRESFLYRIEASTPTRGRGT